MDKIHDLTLPYDDKVAKYSWEVAKDLEKDGWNARILHIYSHAGTHMDAPFHFGINDMTIDRIAPDRFMTDCWVVRLFGCESGKLINVDDLGDVVDKIQRGDSLLLATGWHNFIGTDKYRNQLPRISAELAGWIVERKLNMVLVEPPSVADPNNIAEVTNIHRVLLGGDIVIVEGICNTEQLKKDKIRIIALPLKIDAGDGAPCRVLAVES